MAMKGDRIAAYARFSSDKQNESSIDDQLRRAHDAAKFEGKHVRDDLVFKDEAISGASTKLDGRDALMRKVKAREIDVLIVESTSRLARDMEHASRLHKELAFYGVQLIAIADGIDSSRKGTKQQLGLKALMDDAYLDQLADQTLRGMKGRAEQGLATGGTPFGYRSVPISSDPRRPEGYRVEVEIEEAKIVIRIFREYAAGKNRNEIAKRLNADGVPSPRAGSRHRRQRGWIDSTIGVILNNTKYAGVWTFNERRWVKNPTTGKRVPIKNDPSEVKRWEGPRIIDEDLWEAAQARLKHVHDLFTRNGDGTKKGRAVAGQTNAYPLSGLLTCGRKKANGAICGAPMVIRGGSSRRYYRCSDDAQRGTCSNHLGLREDRMRRSLLDALHERVASSQGLAYLRKKYVEWVVAKERSRGTEHDEVHKRMERTQARIAKGNDLLLDGHDSDSLRATVRDLEAQLKADRRAAAELEAVARAPVNLPSPDEVLARVMELEARLREDPVGARESLRRALAGGDIIMTPKQNGTYEARATYYPLAFVLGDSTAGSFSEPAVNHRGSGGLHSGRFTALTEELRFEVLSV